MPCLIALFSKGDPSELKVHVEESMAGKHRSAAYGSPENRRGTGPGFLLGMLRAMTAHNLFGIQSVRRAVGISGRDAAAASGRIASDETQYTCSIRLTSQKSPLAHMGAVLPAPDQVLAESCSFSATRGNKSLPSSGALEGGHLA
jgi:hypothetical protein